MLLLSVVLPVAAHAKSGDIEHLRLCARSGCKTISDPRTIAPLVAGLIGVAPQRAPAPAEFFTLTPERTARRQQTWPRYVYVPDASLVRVSGASGDAEWLPLVWTDGAYERVTRGMTPFPAPTSWTRLQVGSSASAGGADKLVVLGSVLIATATLFGVGTFIARRKRAAVST
jgi:hypothetical protein